MGPKNRYKLAVRVNFKPIVPKNIQFGRSNLKVSGLILLMELKLNSKLNVSGHQRQKRGFEESVPLF